VSIILESTRHGVRLSHAVAAVSLGTLLVPGRPKLIAVGANLAVLPDADVIGFRLGIATGKVTPASLHLRVGAGDAIEVDVVG